MTSEERSERMAKCFRAWVDKIGIGGTQVDGTLLGAFMAGFADGHECGMEEANAMFMKHLERSIASLKGGK